MSATIGPIEGWKFFIGETGLWSAQDPDDQMTIAYVDEEGLNIYDSESYYPGGSYCVPFAVVDQLRELYAKAPETERNT